VRGELEDDVQGIQGSLAQLDAKHGLPNEQAILRPFNRSVAALWQIFRLVSHGKDTGAASDTAARQAAKADEALQAAARYRGQSARVLAQARLGAAGVILALFAAFAWFYWRVARARRTAERLARENRELLIASRHEALTDALTGLCNRRALTADLRSADSDVMLALFDLDVFKNYNDSFGHAAGDALLAGLGERLARAIDGSATAYRMGGDEFCLVAEVRGDAPEAIAERAASALTDSAEGFHLGCSYGVARLPGDTLDPDVALQLADQRMCEDKTSGRVPRAARRATCWCACSPSATANWGSTRPTCPSSPRTAERLGLDSDQVEAILNKPEPLSDEEWAFIRRHRRPRAPARGLDDGDRPQHVPGLRADDAAATQLVRAVDDAVQDPHGRARPVARADRGGAGRARRRGLAGRGRELGGRLARPRGGLAQRRGRARVIRNPFRRPACPRG
jgi:diguanylate cyclase (GGDEF)-like protein